MVDTATITSLREKTGAGMLDCKRALDEAQGDPAKAVEILRKKGLADAAKKSSRATKEGLVAAHVASGGKKAALVELNCETDFVARNEAFKSLAEHVAQAVADGADETSLESQVKAAVAKTGENIVFRRKERFELKGEGLLHSYVHLGGKAGALVELSCGKAATASAEAFKELAKELGLQIVGASPKWVSRQEVPQDILAKEREIFAEQMRKEGKPEAQIAKIVEGKLNKFYSQWCLVDQPSVRDTSGKTTVGSLISAAAAKTGDQLSVRRFVRFVLGAE